MYNEFMKMLNLNQYELPVEVVVDGDGFLATCPIWPDCYAQGDSVDEVTAEIINVAAGLIDLCKDEDIDIPLKLKSVGNLRNKITFNLPLNVSLN